MPSASSPTSASSSIARGCPPQPGDLSLPQGWQARGGDDCGSVGARTRDSTSALRSALVRARAGGTVQVQRRNAGRQVRGDGGCTLRRQRGRAEPRAEGGSERSDGHAGSGPGEEGVAGLKRGGRAWRGPFVMSHGACGQLCVMDRLRRPALSCLYPVRHSAAHPHRYGLGMVRTSRTSPERKTRGVETSHMRLKTCTSLGACFGTSHPRGRASSAPRPGSAGREWWRRRDGKGHPGLSFLLIDVDRTGSAQSCPALALRQAQIRLPRQGRGPSAFALATGPLAPVPGDPHHNKE